MQVNAVPPASVSPAIAARRGAVPSAARPAQDQARAAWREAADAQICGDVRRLVEASQTLAALCLAQQDGSEAQWHLGRARALLAGAPTTPATLVLQCDWVVLAASLAGRYQAEGDATAARRLGDEARDMGFEAVRRSGRLDDVACAVSAVLRVADALDALGDTAEADRLRVRAFRGVGQGSTLPA